MCGGADFSGCREAMDKKAAAERYAKLHAQGTSNCSSRINRPNGLFTGKTEQAKNDMARLQEIRKKREADAQQRKAREEGESRDILLYCVLMVCRGEARSRGKATGANRRQKVGFIGGIGLSHLYRTFSSRCLQPCPERIKSRISLGLFTPDALIPKHLFKHSVDIRNHILRLHASALFLECPSGACTVECRAAVGCEEGNVFPEVGFFAWWWMAGVPERKSASRNSQGLKERTHRHP
jgi:hypothetical protein